MPEVAHFRAIPKVDTVLGAPDLADLLSRLPRALVLATVRRVLGQFREALRADPASPPPTLARAVACVQAELVRALTPSLRPVINATGVVLHTNLGRAPLAEEAIVQLAAVARGYSNLEFDLAARARGSRQLHVEGLFRDLTGAEAALVVNNNAAAVLLLLTALAAGREVIVSRGELVEIGGSFRMPDVMAAGGAILREVGTTNRTRVGDYAAAITPNTALILSVHPSNFAVVGFTESTPLPELAALAHERNVLLAFDQGSGTPVDLRPLGLPEAAWVGQPLADGVDLVCFSGDKLLGGPQAGIILGRTALVERLRRHPLHRAVRVDKLTIAALQATVAAYHDGSYASRVPTIAMLARSAVELRAEAERLCAALEALALPGVSLRVAAGVSRVGGGSAPTTELPTWLVALRPTAPSASALDERLRARAPAVLARVADAELLFDPRTLRGDETAALVAAVAAAFTVAPSDAGASADAGHAVALDKPRSDV